MKAFKSKKFLKESTIWGLLLWFVGYVLGIIFFMFLPQNLIGFFVMPIGVLITLWILIKKVENKKIGYYFSLAVVWVIIAVTFDYLFIVKMFKSTNYYKLDVYLYYFLTFTLPPIVGWLKNSVFKK
jgi:hypothetical protein